MFIKRKVLFLLRLVLQIDLQKDVGGFSDRKKYDRQDDGRDDRDQRSRFDRGQNGYRCYPREIKIFDVLHIVVVVSGEW